MQQVPSSHGGSGAFCCSCDCEIRRGVEELIAERIEPPFFSDGRRALPKGCSWTGKFELPFEMGFGSLHLSCAIAVVAFFPSPHLLFPRSLLSGLGRQSPVCDPTRSFIPFFLAAGSPKC